MGIKLATRLCLGVSRLSENIFKIALILSSSMELLIMFYLLTDLKSYFYKVNYVSSVLIFWRHCKMVWYFHESKDWPPTNYVKLKRCFTHLIKFRTKKNCDQTWSFL